MGEVEVYISDASVKVDLDVQVFDWADWTRYDQVPSPREAGGHAMRMILWLHGDRAATVRWAVVLSGGARYRDPLPLPPVHSPDPIDGPEGPYLGGSMRAFGDVQVVEGIARVGPEAFTERPADWDGEAVGEFLTRSGHPPRYGSRSVIRLPSFHGGYSTAAEQWFANTKEEMFAPESFTPYVGFGTTSLPEFIRVDFANPAIEGRTLGWTGEEIDFGATVLLTDMQAEQEEANRSQIGNVLMSLGAGALLTAFGMWLSYVMNRGRLSNVSIEGYQNT